MVQHCKKRKSRVGFAVSIGEDFSLKIEHRFNVSVSVAFGDALNTASTRPSRVQSLDKLIAPVEDLSKLPNPNYIRKVLFFKQEKQVEGKIQSSAGLFRIIQWL